MPRRLKVVVAHHVKTIADTQRTILELLNVDAKAAYSGVSALELVLSTRPDLAILCIVPAAHTDDLNGVYGAIVVRTLMPDCRVVLCPGGSGSWVDEPLALAKARGYEFELAAEPVQPETLYELAAGMTVEDIEPIRTIAEAKAWGKNLPASR